MGLYIKGAEMPTTGIYQCSIDNSNGNDKTVLTVYKRKNDGEVIVLGTHEITELPPHGDLIDLQAMLSESDNGKYVWAYDLTDLPEFTKDLPVVIPAEKGEK